MKVSKLFHWLYAILMFLPVFFIAGRTLYVTFNKNAVESYSLYEERQNFRINGTYTTSSDETIQLIPNNSMSSSYSGFQVNLIQATYIDPQIYTIWNLTNEDVLGVIQIGSGGSNGSRINLTVNGVWVNKDNVWGVIINSLSFKFNNGTSLNIAQNNVNYIALVSANVQGTLDNAFTYSVNQLNEVALFSWAKDSFVKEPFTYITGLFGVQSDSPINTMFSYWASVSICWLVFDLLMYVPLLAHRWIDKGIIE